MAYQSRKRDYKTPREKNAIAWRNSKVIVFFVLMALTVLIVKNRHDYWAYIQTYFY